MKKIGITGGIGSGKTTVCEIFKLLDVPVFHADDEARKLQNTDLQIRNLLIEQFGEHIYTPDGILDRKMLAGIIFKDKKALAAINAVIHPAVWQSFSKWADSQDDEPYILCESAILLESESASSFDRTILIIADEKIRIERVIRRDNISEDLVKLRIANQMSDFLKINSVDYIIDNNNENLLIPQIIEVDKLIRAED